LDCFLNQDETVLGCRKRLPIVRHDPATGIYHNRDNPVSVGIDERDYLVGFRPKSLALGARG
jgi:hypothetical protein